MKLRGEGNSKEEAERELYYQEFETTIVEGIQGAVMMGGANIGGRLVRGIGEGSHRAPPNNRKVVDTNSVKGFLFGDLVKGDGRPVKGNLDVIDNIIMDGSHLENGKLKPNVTYKTGEHDYIYKTNEDGLIVNASTDNLQLKTHEGRLNHNPNTYGKKTGDHAGHLFGDRFGGSPELDNLVSQAKSVNLSEYKVIENQWAKALENGQKVTVDININYDVGGSRPVSFDVSYTIDDVYYYKKIYN